MKKFKLHWWAAAVSATALALAACGGGDSASGPKVNITKVTVAGDSLADVGTFGLKFTVQNAANPATGFPIWTQLVAQSFGVNSQCNFYAFTGTTFIANPTPGCTNYAIGAGRIVNVASQGGAAGPQSIPLQLATAGASAGTWTSTDLILVDGGGNDAADLVGAYLGAGSGAAGQLAYQNFLLQQIDATTLGTVLSAGSAGPANAAGLYMQKLADTYYNAIKTHTLDRGATRVAVLNVPDITLSPRFQATLAGVSASAGTATAAGLKAGIQQWISAFNTQLNTRVGTDSRIAVVDFYGDFASQVAGPAAYGLTDSVRAACPVTGTDSSGLPSYTFTTCTSAALDAAPPSGMTAGWWKTWAFSDGFHPTPYGHQLLANSVNRALSRAGWL